MKATDPSPTAPREVGTDAPSPAPRVTLAAGAPFLVELVDRQFALLSSRDADRLLMTLARVLALLDAEPTLAALTREFDDEVAAAVRRYAEHERENMAELARLWELHRARFYERAGTDGFDREALDAFPRSLVPLEHLEFPQNEEPRWDRASSRHRLSKLRFWVTASRERTLDAAERAALLNLEEHLTTLRERHEEAFRTYRTFGVTLPGAALARLRWATGCLNPRAARSERDTPAMAMARAREEVAEALHEPTKRRMLTGGPGSEVLIQARRDAELLREELVLALGRARAGRGRLLHFAEKVARFHAGRLAKQLGAARGRAGVRAVERELAERLAEHFFDGGILAGLTPEGPSVLLVEVRHLARPTEAKARAVLVDACDTLARAAQAAGTRRGALLVVQRDGPRLVLPPELGASLGATLLVATLHVGAEPPRRDLHVV
ncbi:MAG: hypothetical protein IPQ09_11280 [Myxococcales bacterium]|nr:hypothetical protein [Myxococcales bacterium]